MKPREGNVFFFLSLFNFVRVMLALQAYTLVPRHVPYARYGHSKDISVMKFIMVVYIWLSYVTA